MKFLLDSGANYHIISSKNGLVNLRKVDIDVEMAKGKTNAQWAGDGFFKIKGDRKSNLLKLTNCLVIEGIPENLISVSQLGSEGYTSDFGKGEVRIKRKGFTEFIIPRNREGMYELDGEVMHVIKVKE